LQSLIGLRDEIKTAKDIDITGMRNSHRLRQNAQKTVDELFSPMKPLNEDRSSREKSTRKINQCM
jgi:hypothetical protein